MPYANAEGEGRGAGRCDAASSCAEAGCCGAAWRGVEAGGGGDGPSGRASHSAFAMAASPLKGPGWTSRSPATGSRSKLKASCSGTSRPRKAATSGGTWRFFDRVHAKPCAEGSIELLKAIAAACISHGVG
eukprot:6213428-Pleurochrysis_carterae.AAC.3